MAITFITEALSGSTAKQDRTYQRTYTRVIQVETDSPKHRAKAIRDAVGVTIGNTYKVLDPEDGVTILEQDTGSFCQSISVSLASQAEDGCQWDVTLEYGPYDPTTFPANPIDHPLKITWGSNRYEKVVEQDINGNPILNSAGDYFDPPITRDDSRPILRVQRNEATFDPQLAQLWKDTVNTDVFFGFAAGLVKVADITGDLAYNPECGWYYQVTYEFEINPDGWELLVLDQGIRTLDTATNKQKAALDKEGKPVTSPVLLNGSGQQLTVGADPTFLPFKVYKEAAFSALSIDPTGAPGQ